MSFHWLDSKIVDSEQVSAPVSRGLWYGDGCFETLLIDAGRVFRLREHLERLKKGLHYLGFPEQPGLDDQIQTGISELLRTGGLEEKQVRLRVQVWREGSGGFAPPDDQKLRVHIVAAEQPANTSALRLSTVPTRRIPSASVRSDLKLSSSANYIRAAYEARSAGADEALMLTTDDYISETTIANIFWMKGDTIYTPSTDCDILPGIMRQALMEWIDQHQNQFRLVADRFPADALNNADLIWLTNSVRVIQPVASVDQVPFIKSAEALENIEDNFRLFLAERYTTIV